MKAKHVLVLCLLPFITSCSRKETPAMEPEGDGGGGGGGVVELTCSVSGRPIVGRPFEILVQRARILAPAPRPIGRQANPVERTPALQPVIGGETVTLSSQDDVTFSPSTLELSAGDRKQVKATINSTQTGLASFSAQGTAGGSCQNHVVAGFLGHLKADPGRLGYNKPQTLTVDLQDSNGNALPVNIPIFLYIETNDALLTQVTVAHGRDRLRIVGTGEVFTQISPGAFSTSPLSIISPSIWGGPVHLTVIARTSDFQTVAQGNFTFESDPVTWLPISLAIGGGLLYGIYSLAQNPKLSTVWKRAVPLQVVTSIVAGVLAYLTANLDLFGIKLDPNVLRTYPLLGFLFSYIGIDRLFAKRFGQDQSGSE